MIGEGVSRELVVAASMLIRIANPDDRSLHTALSKAEERVLIRPWAVDGGVLQIRSWQTPGLDRHTDGETCDCKTRRGVCWHRATWLLLCTIAAATHGEMPMARPAATAAGYDDRDLTDPTRNDYPPELDLDPPPPPPILHTFTQPNEIRPPSPGRRYFMSDQELERRHRLGQEYLNTAQEAGPLTPGPRREPDPEEALARRMAEGEAALATRRPPRR